MKITVCETDADPRCAHRTEKVQPLRPVRRKGPLGPLVVHGSGLVLADARASERRVSTENVQEELEVPGGKARRFDLCHYLDSVVCLHTLLVDMLTLPSCACSVLYYSCACFVCTCMLLAPMPIITLFFDLPVLHAFPCLPCVLCPTLLDPSGQGLFRNKVIASLSQKRSTGPSGLLAPFSPLNSCRLISVS